MKLSDLIDSKYLRQEHVEDETVSTIRKITKTNVARDDEEPQYKAVIKFDEFEKPMVANATNLKRIAKALGDDLDNWIGQKVIVYVDPDVEYGGKITGGLRIRAMTRAKAASAPRQPSMDDINRDLNRQADDDLPPL